jgi:hypothetical protein
MCGIVGYTGPREAGPILIEGSNASSTAADSAGIAPSMTLATSSSRSGPASWSISRPSPTDATRRIGLAHTRWATHGRPNDLNAHPTATAPGDHGHPQRDIENFREFRDDSRRAPPSHPRPTPRRSPISSRGYGDLTDRPRCPAEARGAYAIVVMHIEKATDRSAPADVPLVVGLGDGEVPRLGRGAILAHTDPIVFPEDGDVAALRPGRTSPMSPARRWSARHDHRLVARPPKRRTSLHAQGDPRAAQSRPVIAGRSTAPPIASRSWPVSRPADRHRVELTPAAAPVRLAGRGSRDPTGPGSGRANVGSEFRLARRRSTRRRWSSRSPVGETADTIFDPAGARARLPGHRGHQHGHRQSPRGRCSPLPAAGPASRSPPPDVRHLGRRWSSLLRPSPDGFAPEADEVALGARASGAAPPRGAAITTPDLGAATSIRAARSSGAGRLVALEGALLARQRPPRVTRRASSSTGRSRCSTPSACCRGRDRVGLRQADQQRDGGRARDARASRSPPRVTRP